MPCSSLCILQAQSETESWERKTEFVSHFHLSLHPGFWEGCRNSAVFRGRDCNLGQPPCVSCGNCGVIPSSVLWVHDSLWQYMSSSNSGKSLQEAAEFLFSTVGHCGKHALKKKKTFQINPRQSSFPYHNTKKNFGFQCCIRDTLISGTDEKLINARGRELLRNKSWGLS